MKNDLLARMKRSLSKRGKRIMPELVRLGITKQSDACKRLGVSVGTFRQIVYTDGPLFSTTLDALESAGVSRPVVTGKV